MIKPTPHSRQARSSLKALWRRVLYIVDPKDKNHLGKLMLPARNHNCTGQDARHFLLAVVHCGKQYKKRREGKRGKRTRMKWGENIFSSQEGAVPRADGTGMEPCLSAEERATVEKAFLAGPFRNAAIRLAWHICLRTGRCDCHFLVSECDDQGVVWENLGYGKGQKNLKLEFERIEEKFIRLLNAGRSSDLHLKNARQAHIEKRKAAGQLTFAEKLSKVGWNAQAGTLPQAVERAGYKLIKLTGKQVIVQNLATAKIKQIKYNLSTLSMNCVKKLELPVRKSLTAAPREEMEI